MTARVFREDMRRVTEHLLWVKTEERARELEALGWRFVDRQRISHHHFYACLMRWEGEGEPVMAKAVET